METPAAAPSTKWTLRLPAGTSVSVYPTKCHWDIEEYTKPEPEPSPEVKAAVARFMAQRPERRRLDREKKQKELARLRSEQGGPG